MTSGPRERTRRDVPYVVPSWTDPIVARATEVIGGPVGRYAVIGGRGLVGVSVALVAMATSMLALGVWQKGHCLMKGWSTPSQFWRACYSDLPVTHVSSALAARELPWSGATPSNQPPLSGLVMWLIAQVSPRVGQGVAAQQAIFISWVLLSVLLLAAAVVAGVALQPRRPWQVAQLAVSPVIVTLALVSTDLLGITVSMLGLWAWRKERPWVAGALLGLAALVRPFPLLFVVAIVLLLWRRGEALRAAQVLVGTLLGALAVVVPLVTLEPQALAGIRDWWGQGAGFGALQMVPTLLRLPAPVGYTAWIALAGWAVAILLGAVMVRRVTWRALGVPQVAALMMIVVVLTAQSLSVQSGLWLLPLLALSTRPWWEHLLWAFVETVHFVMTWLHIAFSSDPGRGLPGETYGLVIILRLVTWTWILWRIWDSPDPSRPRWRLEPSVSAGRAAPAASSASPRAAD